jgi:uncharacterized protein YegJ (DUF2314 family)
MRFLLATIAAFALLTQPALAQKDRQGQGDTIVEYADDDAAMNAAIESARASLPHFFAEFDAAPAQGREAFSLKVGMPTSSGGQEHIWVDQLRREGHELVGALANEPNWLPGMHLGSRVVIDPELISDWSIMAPEGLYGSYTTRVMLPALDAATAAQMRELLTDSPTPAHWQS